jgi:hypothetical protein
MERQQILYLWLAEGALDTNAIGWAFHDGARGQGPALPSAEPPYPTGLAAVEDGWFLIQSPAPYQLTKDLEHETSYLPNEFVFERRVELDPETP